VTAAADRPQAAPDSKSNTWPLGASYDDLCGSPLGGICMTFEVSTASWSFEVEARPYIEKW